MMHIVFDANLLIADPSRSRAALGVLTKLSFGRQIKVYIPDIAEKEFIFHRKDEILKKVSKGSSGISELRRLYLSVKQLEALDGFSVFLANLSNDIHSREIKEFYEWKRINNILSISSRNSDLTGVFDDYFNARPPFLFSRDRKNLPDAFIINSIKKHFRHITETVIVISDDNNFRDSLPTKFISYLSIDEALKDANISSLINANLTDLEQTTIDVFVNEMSSHIGAIERGVLDFISNEANDKFVDEFDGEYARSYDSISLNITDRKPNYYGDGEFYLEISGSLQVYTSIITDHDNKSYIKHHLDVGFHITEQNGDFLMLYNEEEVKFTANAIIIFDVDDMKSGKLLRDGLFFSLFKSNIEIEDLKFYEQ